MPGREFPLLALTLASAARSSLQLDEAEEERLRETFTGAVAEMDAADREYRAAIERTLPRAGAHAMLSAMAAFRERAHEERMAAVREIREIYARGKRPWDWLDPLDVHAVPPHGLSHADATRVSAAGDRARSRVAALRAQANESLQLDGEQTQHLRDAKLRRRDAFAQAVMRALELAGLPDEKTAGRLCDLADGWY